MSSNEDHARLIAERVARRLATEAVPREHAPAGRSNGGHQTPEYNSGNRRARVVNFISPSPPPRTPPSIGTRKESRPQAQTSIDIFESRPSAPQVAQSPWLAPFSSALNAASRPEQNPQFAIRTQQSVEHPSHERFAVEEAAVSELVEFFEAEKQCSIDPSGKPCDHCAMCSSRGF